MYRITYKTVSGTTRVLVCDIIGSRVAMIMTIKAVMDDFDALIRIEEM